MTDEWFKRPPTTEELIEAELLIRLGYKSVSNKYRLVVRLPDGMTGNQALRWGQVEYAKMTKRLVDAPYENMKDREAAGLFMRVYSCYTFAEHLCRHLTWGVFRAFKKLGGESA